MNAVEIGGYRELDLRGGFEYYKDEHIARLNAARCGIYHALRCLNCRKILLPYYQCGTVQRFLARKGIEIEYYHIGYDFLPLIKNQDNSCSILIVNYFGLISEETLRNLAAENKNVIIDQTQAFFQPNVEGAYSVYSPRKFFGVPDGCYVIGPEADRETGDYAQDESSSTASFLLARIETGGDTNYYMYLQNEERINNSDVLSMSSLTQALLDNVDYEYVKKKRQSNYDYAARIFDKKNLLNESLLLRDASQTPMVYPLLIENEHIRFILKDHHIFVGQWWRYLLNIPETSDWEKRLSMYILPIQIDQRYGPNELDYTAEIINRAIWNG